MNEDHCELCERDLPEHTDVLCELRGFKVLLAILASLVSYEFLNDPRSPELKRVSL